MTKESKKSTIEVKKGDRIEWDNYQLIPMLDKDGNTRPGNRGDLVKYGYKRVQGEVLHTMPNFREGYRIQVQIDGLAYDQWLLRNKMGDIIRCSIPKDLV